MSPIYVVTGLPRTGTSMMVRCLSLSGITAVVDPTMDAKIRANETKTYDPNPNGYYAIDFFATDPKQQIGKVIKLPLYVLTNLGYQPNFKVLLMTRSTDESKASFLAAFGFPIPDNFFPLVAQVPVLYPDVITLDYASVVSDPTTAFTVLQKNGWPTDPKIASQYVQPDLYRVQTDPKTGVVSGVN